MKFTCEKSVLQEAGIVASRAVASKSPIAALEGILFEAGVALKLTGFDLKEAIYTSIEADVAEPGSMILNARFFNELIRRLPDGLVTFTCDEKLNVNVRCGRSEFSIIGLDTSDYPEMPSFNGTSTFTIPQNLLKNMISRSIFAVAKDEIRPVYTGAQFELQGSELTVVAVDGYRLARRVEHIENKNTENTAFVVPGFALSDVEKICADTDEPCYLSIGGKHISFTVGSTVVVTRRLEGDFLNHRKSVPVNFRTVVGIDRGELISVIDRVSLVLNDKNNNPVRMTFDDGRIHCVCSASTGKAEDTCSCDGDGEGIEIGFNDRYLLDALKACEKDELQLCLNTSSSPCVIRASDGSESFTYMILPVRLHA